VLAGAEPMRISPAEDAAALLRCRADLFESGELRWVNHCPEVPGEACLAFDGTALGPQLALTSKAYEALAAIIGLWGRYSLSLWNDAPGCTVDAVIAALRAAADCLDDAT